MIHNSSSSFFFSFFLMEQSLVGPRMEKRFTVDGETKVWTNGISVKGKWSGPLNFQETLEWSPTSGHFPMGDTYFGLFSFFFVFVFQSQNKNKNGEMKITAAQRTAFVCMIYCTNRHQERGQKFLFRLFLEVTLGWSLILVSLSFPCQPKKQ